MQQSVTPKEQAYRPDIEGLRAIAVLMVLLAHGRVPGFSGGFAGVDVFFVISGFLITGLLVREAERDGRISYVDFWARRAKRLLPASSLVLVATILLSWLAVPAALWNTVSKDIIASALYVVNWRFADQSVDYFAHTNTSPVQHFWSLAVEEQYYVVWPLLLGLLLFIARRAQLKIRAVMAVGLALILLPSFIWALVYTNSEPAKSYFVTTTRLWELAAGALVAVAAHLWIRLSRQAAAVAAIAGALGLLLTVPLSKADGWPGVSTLLPVLATVLVIVAGFTLREGIVHRVLASAPMVWIGGLSYGIYLWHFPLITIADLHWGELAWPLALAIALGSVVPAFLTQRLLENPVRFAGALKRAPWLAIGVGAVCTLLGVSAGGALAAAGNGEVKQAASADVRGVGDAIGKTGVTTPAKPGQKAPPNPLLLPPDPAKIDLAIKSITPDPLRAAQDVPKHSCLIQIEVTIPKKCVGGDPNGSRTLALVGDSKADMWADAVSKYAADHHLKLEIYTKASCPLTTEPIYRTASAGHNYRQCTTWVSTMLQKLTQQRPVAVVTSGYAAHAIAANGSADTGLMTKGYVDAWTRLKQSGIPVIAIADVPDTTGNDTSVCVSGHRGNANQACAYEKNGGSGSASLQQAAQQVGSQFVTVNDWVCPTDKTCPVVVGNVLVFRDDKHLTQAFVTSLYPVFEARMERAFGAAGVG
ncbi:acyltransferase family protein [Calidifontibacter terrae]